MRRIPLFIALMFLAVACGCGYTTRGGALLEGDPSIRVDSFTNKIDLTREISDDRVFYAYKPSMESDVTRAIIDRFIFDGNYAIRDKSSAGFLLKGDLVDFVRQPLRYDSGDNVTEYRLSVVVDMELRDLNNDKVVWKEERFAGESTYRTTGELSKSEASAVDEAVEDLARRIVERTVENW